MIDMVKDCGAKGDGKADDSAAFRKALGLTGTNGTILFPQTGYAYLLSGPFVISSAARISGEGGQGVYGPSLLNNLSANSDLFRFVQGSEGSEVCDVALRAMGSPSAGSGIRISPTSSVDGTGLMPFALRRISVSNFYDGIVVEDGNEITFEDVKAMVNLRDGIRVTGGIAHHWRDVKSFGNGQVNYDLVSGGNAAAFWITDCESWGGQHGMVLGTSPTQGISQVFAKGFCADSAQGDAIVVNNGWQVEFEGSWAGSYSTQASATGHGINVVLCDLFRWHGGSIRCSPRSGLYVGPGARNVWIDHAQLSGAGFNNPAAGDRYGVYALANCTVESCIFGPSGKDPDNVDGNIYAASGVRVTSINNQNDSARHPLGSGPGRIG